MIRGKSSTTCGTDVYQVPAVVLPQVRIADFSGKAHPHRWPALVDTGADRSVVPISACRELGLAPRGLAAPVGFNRAIPRTEVPVYYISIGLPGIGDFPLRVYGVERSNVLVGRDLLSLARCVMVLDSDRLSWQMGRQTILSKALLAVLRFT